MSGDVLTKEALMQRAVAAAARGMTDGRGGPFGAVIARNGNVIAEGANRVVRDKDPTAHAEICAIREACRLLDAHVLKGCEIFATCEPCPMCLSAIYWARIDRIYFAATREDAARIGFDDAAIYREVAAAPEDPNRQVPTNQVQSPEALHLFEQWQSMKNKVRY